MHHGVRADAGRRQRGLVGQVADDELATQLTQRPGLGRVADQRPDAVTAAGEQAGDLTTEEAGAAGQEDVHPRRVVA